MYFTDFFQSFHLFVEYCFKKDCLVCSKIHNHIHALAFFWIILRTLEVQIILIHPNDTGYIFWQQGIVYVEFRFL